MFTSNRPPTAVNTNQLFFTHAADPRTVIHETTHGVLHNVRAEIRGGTRYWSAFNEAFAYANECILFVHCLNNTSQVTSYGIVGNDWSLVEPADDTWAAEFAGAPLTRALENINERIKLYGGSGPHLVWSLPINMAFISGAQQLGYAAAALVASMNNGKGAIANWTSRQLFASEIDYAFIDAGIPTKNVTLSPDTAPLIAIRPINVAWGTLHRNDKNSATLAIEAAGIADSAGSYKYKIDFYFSDPKQPGAIACANSLWTSPYNLAGHLGYSVFNSFAVGEALRECAGLLRLLTLTGACNPFEVYVEAELYKGSTRLASTRQNGLSAMTPYIKVFNDANCECTNTCDGCSITKSTGTDETGTPSLVIAFLFVIYSYRRKRRLRS